MTTIVKDCLDGSYHLNIKGSPEKISELCSKSSKPSDLDEKIKHYTKRGYRVIALATKRVNQESLMVERSMLERDLTFLGFLVLENKLKAATFSTI